VAQVRAAGVDLIVDDRADAPGLYLIEVTGSLVEERAWDSMSPKQVVRETAASTVRFPDPGRPRDQKDWEIASRRVQVAKSPRTILFHTREGGMGILQLLERDPSNRSIKIRYKLVHAGHAPSTNPTTSPAP
jgi:hypothetical protein